MRVSFSIKATDVQSALTPNKATLTGPRQSRKFTNSTGRPDRGTTAIPALLKLTAAALASPNSWGNVPQYFLPSFAVTDI